MKDIHRSFHPSTAALIDLLQWLENTINQMMEQANPTEAAVDPIEKTKRYIENHISEEISVDELSQKVYLNPDYLTRIFKREEGTSICRYIVNRRIEIAKKLLIETDKTLGEIAFDVGYFNYSSFYKIFAKMVGCSPQDFRKHYRHERGA